MTWQPRSFKRPTGWCKRPTSKPPRPNAAWSRPTWRSTVSRPKSRPSRLSSWRRLRRDRIGFCFTPKTIQDVTRQGRLLLRGDLILISLVCLCVCLSISLSLSYLFLWQFKNAQYATRWDLLLRLFYLFLSLTLSSTYFCLFLQTKVPDQKVNRTNLFIQRPPVSTVETNWDQLLKPVEIFSTIRTNFFSVLVKIFKIETFESRFVLCKDFFETVETNWDLSRLFKVYWDIEHYWDFFEGLQAQKSLQIDKSRSKKISNIKSTNKLSIRTNCQDLPKISGPEGFLDLDRDFWDWKMVSRQNQDFSIVETNFLKLSRFFLTVETYFLPVSRSPGLVHTFYYCIDNYLSMSSFN